MKHQLPAAVMQAVVQAPLNNGRRRLWAREGKVANGQRLHLTEKIIIFAADVQSGESVFMEIIPRTNARLA